MIEGESKKAISTPMPRLVASPLPPAIAIQSCLWCPFREYFARFLQRYSVLPSHDSVADKPPPPPKKAPPKGKPKGKPRGKPKPKKGRRIKINLRLRQSKITDDDDSYSDQLGWTVSNEGFDEPEEPINKEPEVITHQCSFCGAMMRIPKPTRDRYTVICPHPECGHEDKIGF